MAWIQILHPDLLVIGDGERIDMYRKPSVPADDPRVIGVVMFARQYGLAQHSVTRLSNDNLDYEYVSWAFHQGLMVDSTHELFISPEYRNADAGLLDEVLPVRKAKPQHGIQYVEGWKG